VSPKTLRNLLTALVIVVIGALIAVVLIKTSKKPEHKTPAPARPLVSVFNVTDELETVRVQSFGTVKAKRSITIVPQVSGEILAKSAAFEPGSVVGAGEVLLHIDDTDYVLAYENARSNVAQADYNLALAREEAQVAQREWERMGRTGIEGESTTPSALVLHEPQLKLATANLAAAEAALAQAQINLDRCTITAPFDGRVLAADVDAGQYLRAGNPVGTIYATDMAEVTVSIPDEDLAWIVVGPAADPVDVSARFAGRVHHWIGHAVRLGGAMDTRSRQVPVVIEIPDPYREKGDRPAMVEGMFVQVTFHTEPQPGSVIVPRSALRPGNVVWVIGAGGRIDIRPVTVARAGVEQVVLSEGLQPGERVCNSNLQYVTEGMTVRVEGETGKGGPK